MERSITARVFVPEEPPADVWRQRCDAHGTSAIGYVTCSRLDAHEGPHWDQEERRYFELVDAEGVAA